MKNVQFLFTLLFISFTSTLAAMPVPGVSFFSPQLSPDGSRYLWESLKKSGSVWTSNTDGSNLEFVTTGHSPSWEDNDTFNFVKSADDGHLILWQHLYKYNFHKRTTTLITENSDNPDYQTVSMENNYLIPAGLPLSGKVIAIDPGHGVSTGAYSKHSKKFEDHYVLESAFIVKDYLESSGATVRLTRFDNSVCPALSARVNFSNSVGAKAFVSIHYNAAGNENAHGLEVFNRSYNSTSKAMAKKIHDKMVDASGMHSRGVKGDKEVLGFYLGVLSYKHKISNRCLTEGGFLSNVSDAAEIDRLDWNEGLSWGIYSGICDTLGVEANPRISDALTSFDEGFSDSLDSSWLGVATQHISTDTPQEDNATILLKSMPDENAIIRTGNSCWKDYSISATVRRVSGKNADFGIMARCTLVDNERIVGYLLVADEETNKALIYQSTGNPEDRLIIGSLNLSESFQYTEWHKFTILCKGNLIEAYVDGFPLIMETNNATEPTKASSTLGHGKGGVFLEKSKNKAVLEVDSFSMKSLN